MTFAVLLLLSAAIVFILFPHNLIIRSWGCIACMAAVGLVRMARGEPRINMLKQPAAARPGRSMWAIGFALLAFLAASYFALMQDARHGHQAAWPVYLFSGVAIVCAIFWGYLVASNI